MSKRKLLLLHGALGAASQFDELSKLLSGNFEVMTLNFPGHGGKPLPDGAFSFPLFCDEVRYFLDERRIQTTDIFGYSMGGYAALWMAKYLPEYAGKIFTLATKLDWNTASVQRETTMLDADKMQQKIPAFVKLLEQRHAPEDWKTIVEKTRNMIVDLGIHHLSDDDFRTISNPIRIAVGELDNMVSEAESKHAADLLPNGSIKILAQIQHPFEKVNLDLLTNEINKFFQ